MCHVERGPFFSITSLCVIPSTEREKKNNTPQRCSITQRQGQLMIVSSVYAIQAV